LPDRPGDSLTTLLADNTRFTNLETGTNAYAEAWALNYYLIRSHREAYLRYMQMLAQKPPIRYDTPEQRLAEFETAFGVHPDDLEQNFLRYMRSVR
jgi:hypothetical protein